jgi:tRNA(Ile2) C34 agmatinyltransferase TiaS
MQKLTKTEIDYVLKYEGEFHVCQTCGERLNPKWKSNLCYSCKTHIDNKLKSIENLRKIELQKAKTEMHFMESYE